MERLRDDLAQGRVDLKAETLLKALNDHPLQFTTSSCAGRVQLISVAEPGDKRNSRRWGIWHDSPSLEMVETALARWSDAVGGEPVPHDADTTEPSTIIGSGGDNGDLLYLQVQSPIFHVACKGLEPARRLRALAVNCGWKYSSLRGFKGRDPFDRGEWNTLANENKNGRDRELREDVAKSSIQGRARPSMRNVQQGTSADHNDENMLPKITQAQSSNRVMVELLCSERLDTPLARGPRLFVHGPALAFAVDVARITLERTQARLPKLLKGLEHLL